MPLKARLKMRRDNHSEVAHHPYKWHLLLMPNRVTTKQKQHICLAFKDLNTLSRDTDDQSAVFEWQIERHTPNWLSPKQKKKKKKRMCSFYAAKHGKLEDRNQAHLFLCWSSFPSWKIHFSSLYSSDECTCLNESLPTGKMPFLLLCAISKRR